MPESGIFAAGTPMPVSAAPIPDGALLIEDGRISAVAPLSEIRRDNPEIAVRHFSGSNIIPGAVNAHAHLGFRTKDAPPGGTFSGWLTKLIERLPEKEAWTAKAARGSARAAGEAGTAMMARAP